MLTTYISALMSRHIEAVGVRFRLLTAALNMIQNDFQTNSQSKNILRQRIYSSAFDYFTLAPQTPTISSSELKDIINFFVVFWKALHADAKYIKKETFSGTGKIKKYFKIFLDFSTTHLPKATGENYTSTAAAVFHQAAQNRGNSVTWHASNANPTANQAMLTQTYQTPAARSTTSNRNSAGRRDIPTAMVSPSIDHQMRVCLRKRQLLLFLVSHEVERLNAWLNPLGEQQEATENVLDQYLRSLLAEQKQLKDMARFAWDISPELAVYLVPRLPGSVAVRTGIQQMIRADPEAVSHLPEALPLFLSDVSTTPESADQQRLSHILTWQKCSPVQALSLLCPKLYPPHPATAQYAVNVLRACPPDLLLLYIPQIVQCVRWDSVSPNYKLKLSFLDGLCS